LETFYSRKMVLVKDGVSLAADLDVMSRDNFAKLLNGKGYQISDSIDVHSVEFDRALYQYQKDNGLCIGHLTQASFRHLESESTNPVVHENFMTGTIHISESKNPVDHRKGNHEFRESIIVDSVYASSFIETIKIDSLNILDSLYITNSSFEDIPRRGGENVNARIEGWFDCGLIQFKGESPPDIHPTHNSVWQVEKPAAHGATYLGMVVRDNDSWEAVSQKIEKPVVKGNCYTFSTFLSQSENYISLSRKTEQETNYSTPTVLRIWGANKFCGRKSLLAESEPIAHADWKEYVFNFKAKDTYTYIVLEAFYETPFLSSYSGHILVDGMSDLYQIDCEKSH